MKQNNPRRKIHEEEIDVEGTWAVSYGDMVTLLLTFFILFFNINPNIISLNNNLSPLKISLSNDEKKREIQSTPNGANSKELIQDITELLKPLKGVAVPNHNKVIVDFPGISFFSSGKISLTPKGIKVLTEFATLYEKFMGQYRLVVIAYADSKKVKNFSQSKFSDNLELSALRGVAAIRVLQKAGIPLLNMKSAGFGEMEITLQHLTSLKLDVIDNKKKLSLARRVILIIEPEEAL